MLISKQNALGALRIQTWSNHVNSVNSRNVTFSRLLVAMDGNFNRLFLLQKSRQSRYH